MRQPHENQCLIRRHLKSHTPSFFCYPIGYADQLCVFSVERDYTRGESSRRGDYGAILLAGHHNSCGMTQKPPSIFNLKDSTW